MNGVAQWHAATCKACRNEITEYADLRRCRMCGGILHQGCMDYIGYWDAVCVDCVNAEVDVVKPPAPPPPPPGSVVFAPVNLEAARDLSPASEVSSILTITPPPHVPEAGPGVTPQPKRGGRLGPRPFIPTHTWAWKNKVHEVQVQPASETTSKIIYIEKKKRHYRTVPTSELTPI
eukprot:TRINITY_DN10517_c0_g1_i1.p1 TRINITY_DN10517_c0_g1~~TRINITY_DN10517_c0_g1_i1.p1  ORF type:complete len:176 (+),score=16.46 TRINITY_DN10517_c0_g1_i1:1364-1891(+)